MMWVLLFALLLAVPAAADVIGGRQIEPPYFAGYAIVIDGDTLRIGDTRVRLAGIDAPESGQTCSHHNRYPVQREETYECGRDATATMVALVRDRIVTCQQRGDERSYGRIVAYCSTDAGDLGSAMVRAGWAVRYAKYDRECRYCADEEAAKAEARGMWSGRFDMPEQWRREHRR